MASPDYLQRCGTPASLQDLEKHRGVIYSYRGSADWRFRMGRKFVTVHPSAALRVNNGLLMRDAAIAGLGIALLATFLLETPLKSRALRAIDIGADAEGATIYIAYPEHLRSSGKIRALTAWLQTAYWDSVRSGHSRSEAGFVTRFESASELAISSSIGDVAIRTAGLPDGSRMSREVGLTFGGNALRHNRDLICQHLKVLWHRLWSASG